MEINKNVDSIVLKKEEYCTLIEHLTNMNNRINELIEVFSSNKEGSSLNAKSITVEDEMKNDIKKLREQELINQNQYKVLKYMLKNEYRSDMDISKSAGVSYSSLSQWKRNDSYFKTMYKKILLLKDM